MYINSSSIISSLKISAWVNCVHMKPTNINKLKYNPYIKVSGVLYRNISLFFLEGEVLSPSQKNRLCKTVLWFLFIKSKCKSRFNQMLVKASRGEAACSVYCSFLTYSYRKTNGHYRF